MPLKHWFNQLKSFFTSSNHEKDSVSAVDLDQVVEQIREHTSDMAPEPGRRIHHFYFQHFDISLDMDITKTYRVTVTEGKERVYSFTIYSERENYEKLLTAYKRIIRFLKEDRNLRNLPDDDLMKGFYYGG